jgi:histone-lysine N-methyltransferase SETD1
MPVQEPALPSPKSPSPPPVYSLPSPPPWPTDRSEFPQGERTYRILFDASIEKDREGRFRQLIEKIQQLDPNSEHRIKGKGKGKEVLYRYEGEIVEGEHMPPTRDPRKVPGMRRLPPLRPRRGEFHVIKYEVSMCRPRGFKVYLIVF